MLDNVERRVVTFFVFCFCASVKNNLYMQKSMCMNEQTLPYIGEEIGENTPHL